MENKYQQRTDYTQNDFMPGEYENVSPFHLFSKWYDEVLAQVSKDPNAMTLSTFDGEFPRARVILLKELDERGFIYFTNYLSDKVAETNSHPKASLTFFWKELERQVRVQGIVEKVSEEISDTYYNSRPRGSKIGAWASPQSREIESREWLENKVTQYESEFPNEVKRPTHWGGLRLVPVRFEFWQGQSSRLHDRIVFELVDSQWKIKRLAP